MLDLSESGGDIAEKLFVLLDEKQQKELTSYVITRNIQDCSFSGSLPDVFNNSPAQADSIQTLTEIRDGDLYFCLEGRTVCIRDQEIDLTAKEFDALHLLIINRRREDYIDVTAQAIHNLMSRLRQKLQISPDVPEYVTSVRGVGYKFNSQKVNNKK